jgi:ribosome production factor 1
MGRMPAKRRKTGEDGAGAGAVAAGAAAAKDAGDREGDERLPLRNPSHIKNKMKRQQVMAKFRKEKKELRKAGQEARRREQEELGDKAPPKLEPRTIDNTRETEVTMIGADGDDEIAADELDDEFARIFANEEKPKLMITTRPFPSGELYHFIRDLMDLVPNAFYYKRGTFDIKEIVQFATNKEFTHLVVLSEKAKVCNGYVGVAVLLPAS